MQYTYMYVGMEAYKMALQLSDVQCLHSQLWLNDEVLLLDVFNLMMQSLVGVGYTELVAADGNKVQKN